MRIVFIGCVTFSRTAIETLLNIKEAEIVGIVTRKHSTFNADFCSLQDIAVKHEIPCYVTDEPSEVDLGKWIKKCQPDVIYCFGWSYLLGRDILDIPRLGVIGYHPAALPKNRGRHPIIWTLALGLTQTASTFFFMDEGADSGDILSQVFVSVEPQDDASTLYRKLSTVAVKQIEQFTMQLAKGTYKRLPQDHSISNYWRKRTKNDGEIDWRMSAKSIHNLVRALTRPYVGAHCVFDGEEIKVWKTELVQTDGYENIEPGKVLRIEEGKITVKCGEGVIKLIEHQFHTLPEEGCYL